MDLGPQEHRLSEALQAVHGVRVRHQLHQRQQVGQGCIPQQARGLHRPEGALQGPGLALPEGGGGGRLHRLAAVRLLQHPGSEER